MPSIRLSLLPLACCLAAGPAWSATFVVTVSHDNASDCSGGGNCTLRGALAAAAANPGLDRIEFALAQNSVIAPLDVLPTITHRVIIDARPTPDYDGHPWVHLDGLASSGTDGLRFGNGAASSAVYGMAFTRWDGAGIVLSGSANQVRIDGCYFGRNTIGGTAGNGTGIAVLTDNNVIGQQFVAGVGYVGTGNLVIASSGDGILVSGDGNLLHGNSIGGTNAVTGNAVGIRLLLANDNNIGAAGAGNTVVYSAGAGIIVNGNGNLLHGNHVGTNSAQSVRPNGGDGIQVTGNNNIIGGTQVGERNVVAHNATGILLGSPGDAANTLVIGNQVRDNEGTGIRVQAGNGNIIERNIINGNGAGGVGDGVRIDSDGNTLVDNRIGETAGNSGEGMFVSATANGNTIGPGNVLLRSRSGVKVEGADNTILGNTIGREGAGNTQDGVWLVTGASNTVVEENALDANGGNGIRLDADDCDIVDNTIGLVAGNGAHGIRMGSASSGNLIGTQNKIGNNGLDGVVVSGTGNHVIENRIGWEPPGFAVGNGRHGVHVLPDAVAPRIERNRIMDNAGDGILVTGGPSAVVLGNEIGGYPGGGSFIEMSNGGNGILVLGVDDVIIGDGSAEGRNLVLYNGRDGIGIDNASGTRVDGNLIAANLLSGVALLEGAEDAFVFRSEIRQNFSKAIHVGHSAGTGNTFRATVMAGNVVPGIDLIGDGPTANDAGDADEGPNRLQNTPVLLFHAPEGDGLQVGLSVDSDPANAAYPLFIEFYASEDPAGGGPAREGNVVLGTASYTAPGVASKTVSAPPASARWLLALATDADGNTSEFSAAIPLVAPGPAIFANGFED